MPKIQNQIKFYKYITNAGVSALAILLLLTLDILMPIKLSGETAVAAGDSTSTTSLTLDVASSTAGVELLVTSSDGTFASTPSGSELSFDVATNNITGYMLSISAKSGTDLTNSTAGTSFTSLDAMNSTIVAGITADTFGNASNTVYNNMWGFKPSYYKSSTNSDKFYPSPTTSGVVLNKTTCANNTASSDSPLCQASSNTYTIAIGARATYAQVAGIYSNAYILSAVGNYPEYKITYNDASGDGSDLPSTQEATSETNDKTTINFSDKIPTRDGYEFVGWCSVDNSSDPTSCSGTTYDPGDEYALSTLSSNVVPLYAIWQKTKIYMQDLTLNDCKVNVGTNGNATNIGDNITVYDKRDDSDYTVRYINGRCWMTQNLRFVGTELNSTTSNVASAYTETSPYYVNGSEAKVYYDLDSSVENSTYVDHCDATNGYNYACAQKSDDIIVGAWYNYAAVSAGTIIGNNSTEVASYDICPAGWRLPIGYNSKNGTDAYRVIGNATADWQDATISFVALGGSSGGHYYNGQIVDDAQGGALWSNNTYTTSIGPTSRYLLRYSGSKVIGNIALLRYYGYFVRCVMNPAADELAYLQEVAPSTVTATPDGTTVILGDVRDGNKYSVTNTNGQLWMTTNLMLGDTLEMSISGTDSNVSDSGYTLPASSKTGFANATKEYLYRSDSLICDTKSPCYTYYSYRTATAGNNTSSSNASTYDICPLGWRLPTRTEFENLVSVYSTSELLVADWFAVYAGYYIDSTFNNGGIDWYYWSANAFDSSLAYALNFNNNSSSRPNVGFLNKRRGHSIRCIAKNAPNY